jgi:UDP-N-acetylmuramate dehydrogenase
MERNLFERFLNREKIIFRRDVPLSRYTTFKIGGKVDYFLEPRTSGELSRIVQVSNRYGIRKFILGNGSNLLVQDGALEGAVLWLGRLNNVKRKGKNLVVESGYTLSKLVKESVALGLSGLEVLVGIPGSLGGAIRTNAGGRYGQISDLISLVEGVSKNGRPLSMDGRDITFGYRDSHLDNFIITRAILKLREDNPEKIRRRYSQILAEKRRTQPLGAASAGCIFKNPQGISAGRIIDQLGLKGTRVGDAYISEKHANFIINGGRASARDVMGLIKIIREKVKEAIGIELELEIKIWQNCV